jgi:hypothetical protein
MVSCCCIDTEEPAAVLGAGADTPAPLAEEVPLAAVVAAGVVEAGADTPAAGALTEGAGAAVGAAVLGAGAAAEPLSAGSEGGAASSSLGEGGQSSTELA